MGRLSAKLCEGFIVDTDHWRHFFLLLGLIWGLTAATINLPPPAEYCRRCEPEAATLAIAS